MQLSTEASLMRLLDALERELPAAVELRHRLHASPELAHHEHATAQAVEAELPVACEAIAGTGRLARVGSPRGRAVGVRAELDGLPINERTDAPFRAPANMHACGHDVHMAALVALVRAAHGLADELPAPLVAIFQPSEEAYPSGAAQIAAELEPQALVAGVAAHIHPELPWGAMALDPGAVNAASDAVEITIEGEPSHGAYPHQGRDPVLAIAQVVVALHAQVSRRLDPLHAGLVNIGMLEGGTAENVIPQQARARAALRAQRPQERLALRAMVQEVVEGIAAAHGCKGEVRLTEGEPPLENDPRIVQLGQELMPAAGLSRAREWRSYGSDDFAFLGELAPIAIGFVGLDGAPGFLSRPLHHPELLPPDEAVALVARAQALLYLAAADAHGG